MARLFHGDCLEVLLGLEASSIDLVVTSPPYFNARDYSHFSSYSAYMDWLVLVFDEVRRVLKDGCMCCINISPVIEPRVSRSGVSRRYPIPFDLVYHLTHRGFTFLEDIVWVKPEGAAVFRGATFRRLRKPVVYKPNLIHEYILVFQSGSLSVESVLRRKDASVVRDSLIGDGYESTSVWRLPAVSHPQHPAVFPRALSDRLVSYYSFVGDVVLDPFMGVGTTGVSAVSSRRDFVGIEKDAGYFGIAERSVTDAELMALLEPSL